MRRKANWSGQAEEIFPEERGSERRRPCCSFIQGSVGGAWGSRAARLRAAPTSHSPLPLGSGCGFGRPCSLLPTPLSLEGTKCNLGPRERSRSGGSLAAPASGLEAARPVAVSPGCGSRCGGAARVPSVRSRQIGTELLSQVGTAVTGEQHAFRASQSSCSSSLSSARKTRIASDRRITRSMEVPRTWYQPHVATRMM